MQASQLCVSLYCQGASKLSSLTVYVIAASCVTCRGIHLVMRSCLHGGIIIIAYLCKDDMAPELLIRCWHPPPHPRRLPSS